MEVKQNASKTFKLIGRSFIFGLVCIVSTLLTAYIFINSFAVIFSTDFQLSNAFSKSSISQVINYSINQSYKQSHYYNGNNFAKNKNLSFIEIPILQRRLELTRGINKNDDWYIRGNKSNYLLTENVNKSENLIIYLEKSWRTIPSIQVLKNGDLIYITTEDRWNYIFRIYNIAELNDGEKFVLHSKSDVNLNLVIDNSETNGYQLIQAELINSRGI